MSHADFEAIMKRISRASTLVWRAEANTYYNVSQNAADCLRVALEMLEEAAETMDDTL